MKVYKSIKKLRSAAVAAFGVHHRDKWKITGLCIATAMALQSCSIFKVPEPRFAGKMPVKLVSIAPERLGLRVEGQYYNPNNYSFTFTGGELDLKVDTFYLGHVKIDTVMTIPAHATFTVPVVVEPDFVKFSNSGVNVNDSVVVSFTGTMTGKAKGISKKVKITYQGKHLLDIGM